MLRDYAGQPCIKANMGAQYVVTENKTNWYFSVDPSRVSLSGKCSKDEALLSLMLPDNSACLDFTFRKDENNFYVTKLAAQLFPLPVCKGCPNKTYSGILTNQTLFKAAKDKSFKCTSESLLSVSSELRIKLVRLQMQAFGVPDGKFREGSRRAENLTHRKMMKNVSSEHKSHFKADLFFKIHILHVFLFPFVSLLKPVQALKNTSDQFLAISS
uniref:Lysosome-associated membrane glycoprotein 3 n=1 Tax=Poecilia formosa TaxID=48698 RepID=A0A096M515_POEFO